MPQPDPNGLDIDEREDGSFSITAEIWWRGNRRHRIARMRAVARNIACGGWRCRQCATEIALFKRSDARYCSDAGAAGGNPSKNVVFTEADPGHWEKLVALHIPQTTAAGGKLTVKTPHPQSEAHYIVSHAVVLGDGTFVSRKTFSNKDEPISEHMLPACRRGDCHQHMQPA
jgi:hypothetical protein